MAEPKKNYKTLFYRQGQIWVKENETGSPDTISLVDTHRLVKKAVTDRFFSPSYFRNRLYVPYSDFEELRMKVTEIEDEIHQIKRHSAKEMETPISDALSQLRRIKGINTIENHSENGNLILLASVENFSAALFRRIAQVEINLSRKYADLCIEIRPIITDETAKKRSGCEQK